MHLNFMLLEKTVLYYNGSRMFDSLGQLYPEADSAPREARVQEMLDPYWNDTVDNAQSSSDRQFLNTV